MLVRVRAGALLGVGAIPVEIEVETGKGMPGISFVGLAAASVQESKVRVMAAIRNVGVELPQKRVLVNLAPADLRKDGTLYDLPIALALLAAEQKVPSAALDGLHVYGELSFSGEVKPVRGLLPLAIAARAAGARGLVCPAANALEARVVEGLPVHPVAHFGELVAWLNGDASALRDVPTPEEPPPAAPRLDLADVIGQELAKRALEVAAAGAHNLLFFGPPGAGKTMLARRLPSLLPPLGFEEALEATVVHSVAGLTRHRGLLTERPFRAPHHTISDAGLVGGTSVPRPGEVSLAHHGVLFLDELPEFRRHVLEALRQPAEDGEVVVARAGRTATFPSQFMLVAAMNPCPCGHLGDTRRRCRCTTNELLTYRRRISGPLLDRIDLHVDVPALARSVLGDPGLGATSAEVRSRVERARAAQLRRWGAPGGPPNARLRGAALRRHCAPDPEGKRLLATAIERLGLSARGHDKVLRVARTLADLEGVERVGAAHVAEAIQFRALDRPVP